MQDDDMLASALSLIQARIGVVVPRPELADDELAEVRPVPRGLPLVLDVVVERLVPPVGIIGRMALFELEPRPLPPKALRWIAECIAQPN